MKDVILRRIWVVLFCTSLVLPVCPGVTLAQSGSAGGSIGNEEKSLSGSRGAPPTASKPSRGNKAEADEPRRALRKGGGNETGGSNLDGAWVLTSVGTPCGTSSDTVIINGSKMVGQYGTAQVSPNGSTSGIGAAGGITWTMSGRLSGRSGSGTFRRSDGCVGSWTGSKQ